MSQDFTVVIPARLGSTRLPRKPLQLLQGRPLIWHVASRALMSAAGQVVVATDSDEIVAAVRDLPVRAMLTAVDHPTGTDRIAEVAKRLGLAPTHVVVNVQGDEPLVPPAVIDALADALAAHPQVAVATLRTPIERLDEFCDPNVVKVVVDRHQRALYFSRAPIPWPRDAFAHATRTLPPGFVAFRHIGLYAYRGCFLARFPTLAAGELEHVEMLEQLRALANGEPIIAIRSPEDFPAGIDTAADLARVEAWLKDSVCNSNKL